MAKRTIQSFEFIVKEATSATQINTIRDKVAFHYFNPNGLTAKKMQNDREIDSLVDSGAVKFGAKLVYGSLYTYWFDKFQRLLRKKRVLLAEYETMVEMMEADIEKQRRFIMDNKATNVA